PARQQTLRGAIDWSYDLLPPEEQRLFRRLGVFVSGGTLDAVEAICNAEGDVAMGALDGVASLLDKSLLRQETAGAEPRFGLLDTIREYALERLASDEDAAAIHRLHFAYLLSLAQTAELWLTGPQQNEWLDRLEIDHDNFRAALGWARDQ